MMNIDDRRKKLLNSNIRVFFHTSFDDPKERKNILADMPGIDKFNTDSLKIKKLKGNKVSPEMKPCYEAPLLTSEQEVHLFRKMNYLRYKAKKLLSKIDSCDEIKINKIEERISLANNIRNQIAESNFRLATQLLRKNINFYREHSLVESLLSDAYADVLKSVDYFDWTRGYKFSTYATWVLKKNFFRDSKQKIISAEKSSNLDESCDFLDMRSDEYEDEKRQAEQQSLIVKLLDLLSKSKVDGERQSLILRKYFGVNGHEKQTLEEIGRELGVTQERIRQLKEKGLSWIQKKTRELNIES